MTEHVIDANVFIHGSERSLPFEHMMTVPAVLEELQTRAPQTRFDVEEVAVREPDPGMVERVMDAATEQGEDLSETDTQVLALALEREAVLVTDDYGLQNVADALDVAWTGFLQDGITEQVQWKTVCQECGRKMDGETCSRCGGSPKRVPR